MVRWHCGGTRTALGSVWRPIHAQPKDESHSDYSKPPPAGGLSYLSRRQTRARRLASGLFYATKPLFFGAAQLAPARRIKAFLASGLGRTGPGNQRGVTATYTGTPGHNDGL